MQTWSAVIANEMEAFNLTPTLENLPTFLTE